MTKASPNERQLSQRDREILKDVIQTFILSGEPVSSRAVAKLRRHNLSPASIRNIMADLEELGYLTQPHTSAGRIPTPAGYHHYIQALMQARIVPARERRYIDENLVTGGGERLMASASQLLSELSHQIGIVLTPVMGDTVLKAVDFVPLSGRRVLCVLVSASGFVDNKVVETGEPIPRDELMRISNYLNDHFSGLALREVRDRLLAMMADERAQVDRLLANAIALAQQALREPPGPGVLVEGTAVVLSRPELADLVRVRRLLDTFADKARLVQMLNQCIEGSGVRVLIGEDSALTSELDFSLVATSYGVGDQPLGSLGIFGPSRMEYQRIIPLVAYLGETLSEALSRGMEEQS